MHHRIAIDTQPPIPFTSTVTTGLSSDNPSPNISFLTSDTLSGIDRYEIRINSEAPIIASGSDYTFIPHPPGIYLTSVRAYDKAGNSIEDKVNIQIIPIESPGITFITKKVVIGTDDILMVRGVALPDASVIVTLENTDKFLVFQDEVQANTKGEWEFRFEKELRRGKYAFSAQAKDARGALSNSTMPTTVTFADKPVISLLGIDITMRWMLILLVIIFIATVALLYRKTIMRLARAQKESVIISRDLKNAFEMVKKHLITIGGIARKNTPVETRDLEFQAVKKKIIDALDNISKYISGDIERLK
jgi:hypothetical protein